MWRGLSLQRIGLIVEKRRIVAAQMRIGPRPRVSAVAIVEFEQANWLDDPAAAGSALRAALKERGFTGRTAAIGLPASSTVFRQHTMPPMNASQLAGALAMVTDRIFSTDPGELRIDFVPPAESTEPQPVLVSAMLQRRLAQIRQVAEGAGLQVVSATPAVAALAQADEADAAANQLVATIDRSALDIAYLSDGCLASVQHYGLDATTNLLQLSGALRRSLSDAAGRADRIVAYVGPDAPAAAIEAVEQLGLPIERADHPKKLAINGLASEHPAGTFAAAAACALVAAEPEVASINYLHTRLDAPPRQRFGPRARIGALAGAAVLLLVAGLYMLVQSQQKTVDELTAHLASIDDDVQAAREMIDQVEMVERWFADRPRYLDALRQLTFAFPMSGEIWVTELNFREGQGNVMTGRATASQAVIQLRDELQKTPACHDVKLLYMRDAGRGESEVVFSISLRIDPAEIPARPAGSTDVAALADGKEQG